VSPFPAAISVSQEATAFDDATNSYLRCAVHVPNMYRYGVVMRGLRTRTEPAAVSPRFYSVAEVARMFGLSPMTVYRAISAGEFPAVRIRGRLIVPARAVEEMVDAAVADQSLVDAAGWVPEPAGRGV
jgi:excisionase family DNA binding protein